MPRHALQCKHDMVGRCEASKDLHALGAVGGNSIICSVCLDLQPIWGVSQFHNSSLPRLVLVASAGRRGTGRHIASFVTQLPIGWGTSLFGPSWCFRGLTFFLSHSHPVHLFCKRLSLVSAVGVPCHCHVPSAPLGRTPHCPPVSRLYDGTTCYVFCTVNMQYE